MSTNINDGIRVALKGYEPAIQCFFLLRDVLHFWDDLIDGDVEVTKDYVHTAMFKALVELPSNEFYRYNQDKLLPVLVNAIGNWHAANAFEAEEDPKKLELAFVIRSDYANLLVQCAYLVGGYEWLREVTPLIREMWTEENFASYLENLRLEKEARLSRSK